MKFEVIADIDWISGHVNYGHYEGIVEAESEEALKEMMKDRNFIYKLDLVVDDADIDDHGDVGEYEYKVVEA